MSFRIFAIFAFLSLFTVASMGCNTVKGLGTDIQHASEATSRAIDSASK